jgi:hypothetical protein
MTWLRMGPAAPLKGLDRARFHVLDSIGIPLCMRIDRQPAHPVDYGSQMGMDFVPESMRCHRWGCIDAWHKGASWVEASHVETRMFNENGFNQGWGYSGG